MNINLVERQAITSLVIDSVNSSVLKNGNKNEYLDEIREIYTLGDPIDKRSYIMKYNFDEEGKRNIEMMRDRLVYFKFGIDKKIQLIKSILEDTYCGKIINTRIDEYAISAIKRNEIEEFRREIESDIDEGFSKRLEKEYAKKALLNEVLYNVVCNMILQPYTVSALQTVNPYIALGEMLEIIEIEINKFLM